MGQGRPWSHLRLGLLQEIASASTIALDAVQVLGPSTKDTSITLFSAATRAVLTMQDVSSYVDTASCMPYPMFCWKTRNREKRMRAHSYTLIMQVDVKAAALSCMLRVGFSNLPPMSIPLQLRPGAPKSLVLLPGHPWDTQVGRILSHLGPHVSLCAGSAITPARARATEPAHYTSLNN